MSINEAFVFNSSNKRPFEHKNSKEQPFLFKARQRQTSANRDKNFAEFSTLGSGLLLYAVQISNVKKQPSLKLKTLPGQCLGYPPFSFEAPQIILHFFHVFSFFKKK